MKILSNSLTLFRHTLNLLLGAPAFSEVWPLLFGPESDERSLPFSNENVKKYNLICGPIILKIITHSISVCIHLSHRPLHVLDSPIINAFTFITFLLVAFSTTSLADLTFHLHSCSVIINMHNCLRCYYL